MLTLGEPLKSSFTPPDLTGGAQLALRPVTTPEAFTVKWTSTLSSWAPLAWPTHIGSAANAGAAAVSAASAQKIAILMTSPKRRPPKTWQPKPGHRNLNEHRPGFARVQIPPDARPKVVIVGVWDRGVVVKISLISL